MRPTMRDAFMLALGALVIVATLWALIWAGVL